MGHAWVILKQFLNGWSGFWETNSFIIKPSSYCFCFGFLCISVAETIKENRTQELYEHAAPNLQSDLQSSWFLILDSGNNMVITALSAMILVRPIHEKNRNLLLLCEPVDSVASQSRLYLAYLLGPGPTLAATHPTLHYIVLALRFPSST